jgi:hypothetical protein
MHPIGVSELAHDHPARVRAKDAVEARAKSGEDQIKVALNLVRQRDVRCHLSPTMRHPRRLLGHGVVASLWRRSGAANQQLGHGSHVTLVALEPAQQLLRSRLFTAAGLSSTTSTPAERTRDTRVRW